MSGKRKVVIVGGGVMGSACAHFLSSRYANLYDVTVIEKDSTYRQASSALSVAGMRQQFSTPANIGLSAFAADFLRKAGKELMVDGDEPDMGFQERGYLLLADQASEAVMRENFEIQRANGAKSALIAPDELRRRFPWLELDGIALGSLGTADEGWFDGYSLLQAFRRKARDAGCRYVNGTARRFLARKNTVAAIELEDGSLVEADVFVLAAGCWSAPLAATLGIDLPVRPRPRSVFVFSCRTPLPDCPLVVDKSGVYFRPEGPGKYICGASPEEDPDDRPLEVDYAQWNETIWPTLASRVSAFESIRMTGGWAGYYEFNTFDQNGIIGRHSTFDNLVFATGFSGHGMMQSPGVGLSVAEIIETSAATTIDVAALGWQRIENGAPLFERNVI